MYSVTSSEFGGGRARQYTLFCDGRPVTCADALRLWEDDSAFRALCIGMLADAPFLAYRWETPPISTATVERDFEFVLLDSPWLSMPADADTFARYFTDDECDAGVVSFPNLGRDATLVVPSPRAPAEHYADMAAFMRGAPDPQKHALWRVLGRTAREQLDERPMWVSTAGGGVAWLHVRLDASPKYYGHDPYRHA